MISCKCALFWRIYSIEKPSFISYCPDGVAFVEAFYDGTPGALGAFMTLLSSEL